MEFTNTEFKKFKSRILNIEIVAAEAHGFDVSDQFDPPNPEGSILASAIWPHFKNGKSIFASSAGWLFASINTEINENLLLPVNDQQKLTYLKEVKEFCISIENRIIEDKDGKFSTNLYTIDYSLYETGLFDPSSVMYKFLLNIRAHCRKLIIFLHDQIDLLEKPPLLARKSVPPSKIPRSFTLIKKPGAVYDKRLPDVYEMLVEKGFLSNESSKKSFLNLFFGKEVSNPIIWLESNGSLRYFLTQIEGVVIEKLGVNKWKLYCDVFHSQQKGIRFDLPSLRGAKSAEISKLNKKKLDTIIEFLIS